MADLTLNEAAADLGVDTSTLRHQIATGRLKARKVGPIWTVTPGEIARYRAQSLGKAGRPNKPAPATS